MKKHVFSYLRLLLFLLVPALLGPGRLAAWPHHESDLDPDPTVVFGLLENGLRYAVMPHSEPRGRVSLRLLLLAGSLQEREDQRGLAHYLEHMAFRGTENFSPGTLVNYFQRLGMDFGPDANAYTGFDRTVYQVELPDNSLSAIAEALLVLRDFAGRMLLDEDEVEMERGVILSEKRARDSIGFRTALEEFDFLLPETVLARRFPIGSAEVIRAVDSAGLQAFYEAWYRPERAAVIVVGDIAPDEVPPLIAKHFADWAPQAAEPEPVPVGRVVEQRRDARLHTEMEAATTRVSLYSIQPYEHRPDTMAERRALLKRSVALQMLQRRLEVLSRAEDAPFTSTQVSAYELFDTATVVGVEVETRPEQWAAALKATEQEVRRALLHGFQADELEFARARRAETLQRAVREAPTRRARGLAESLVRSLTGRRVFTQPLSDWEWAEPVLSAMTPADSHRALQEAFPETSRLLFVTGNVAFDEPEETILDTYAASREQDVSPPEEAVVPVFAYDDFGSPGRIEEHQRIEDLDVEQWRFENNARLNMKITDFAAGEILLTVRVGGGHLEEPPEKPGLSWLAGEVFMRGGLGSHTYDEIERIMAGRSVGWSFAAADDAFVFRGRTTARDLEPQLRWLAACLTDAGYRPEALQRARARFRELHAAARHTSRGVFGDRVARYLAGGDSRFGLPPLEKTLALDMEDLRQWLTDPLSTGFLEITLIGDIPDRDEALRLVAATVGALPERAMEKQDFHEQRLLQLPRGGTLQRYEYESRIRGGLAAVYWHTTDLWNIELTRRLNILARILSDRLRVRVRETMGETYSPFAVHDPSDTFYDKGWLFGYIDADPDRAEELTAIMVDIAAGLHDGEISEDEKERALRPVLTSLRDALRENRYWMNSVLASSQEYPQRLEWARTMTADHEAITVAELEALAREFLDPEHALRIAVFSVDPEE